jgi:hemolysin III
MISFLYFGLALFIVFGFNAVSFSKNPSKRFKLKIFDHAAIYVLIAGSYTPFTLVSLNGETGWLIFSSFGFWLLQELF